MSSLLAANSYLQSAKAARRSPAVAKLELISLRSDFPDGLVFVFEGDDDKVVYNQWIARINADCDYEPFVCNGKQFVLGLRDAVLRDKGGLEKNVYFFIDRDFDGYAQSGPHSSTFMTTAYSTENYLVCEKVVDKILKTEFHCHSKPRVRAPIVDLFTKQYDQFLRASEEINFRIYVARKENLNIKNIPDKISRICIVRLNKDAQLKSVPEAIIDYGAEPAAGLLAAHQRSFAKLDARMRYRGKFAIKFFMRWLELLVEEYCKNSYSTFGGINRSVKPREHEITLGGLASKSPIPTGLPKFIEDAWASA